MKKTFIITFRLLMLAVLIAKVANWFMHFSRETNDVLNIAMFTLIGINYIIMGLLWDSKLIKAVIITCGVFVIAVSFFSKNTFLNIIGIVCILTPLIIARFNKESAPENSLL